MGWRGCSPCGGREAAQPCGGVRGGRDSNAECARFIQSGLRLGRRRAFAVRPGAPGGGVLPSTQAACSSLLRLGRRRDVAADWAGDIVLLLPA
ncbi:hypothetical protein E2562_034271 [Oryza meyeriana var. granulata]|uniref:Uncharacterized protein n=1 Tax=Oryza meyeriana var. granulata TaxID=110450 RepID=A0A6G1ESI7_9ORYZ|nr:hypothetical protein E2562_034271 [Oryza meyeriana var. granulata]